MFESGGGGGWELGFGMGNGSVRGEGRALGENNAVGEKWGGGGGRVIPAPPTAPV